MEPLNPVAPVKIFKTIGNDVNHNNERCIGIDLGTTHSISAVSDNSVAKTVIDKIQSIVNFSKTGEVVIGDKVESVQWTSVSSVKRLMGKEKGQKIKIFNKTYTPEQISAEILKYLKESSEHVLGCTIRKAVITVPSYFNDAERNSTRFAAQLAGLEEVRLLSEPTAAALAYNIDNSIQGSYVIYDLGGGTFDISVLEMKMGVLKVLATGGDTELGGDDIDSLIAEKLKISTREAREIKHHISDKGTHPLLSKGELDHLITPLVHKTIKIMFDTLADVSIDKNSIQSVLLVGGSTRIPLITEALNCEFNCAILNNADPDRIVAWGAAIRAEDVLENRKGNVLLDVVPLSLGIESANGVFERIVNRNTTIPSEYTQKFTTSQDNQTEIIIHVLQGEREFAKDCRSLVTAKLKNIPPMKAGIPSVIVTFTLDEDGILTVTAQETHSGINIKLDLKPSFGLTRKEMSLMLIDSMENAKSDMSNRLLADIKLRATIDITAVTELMEKHQAKMNPEEKEKIETAVSTLKQHLKSDNREDVEGSVAKLNSVSQNFMEQAVSYTFKDLSINNIT